MNGANDVIVSESQRCSTAFMEAVNNKTTNQSELCQWAYLRISLFHIYIIVDFLANCSLLESTAVCQSKMNGFCGMASQIAQCRAFAKASQRLYLNKPQLQKCIVDCEKYLVLNNTEPVPERKCAQGFGALAFHVLSFVMLLQFRSLF